MQYNTGNIATGASTGATIGSVVPGIGTAIGAGVGALGGAVLSGIQYMNAKNQAATDERNRPKYTIPPEVQANLTAAEQMAMEGLPEEQKRQIAQNLQRAAGYSLYQQGTRKGGLQGIGAIQQNLNQGYLGLGAMDANARMQRQQNVLAQRQNLADYKQQEFQINKLNPYYENIARRNANTGALYQNLSNSLQLGMYAGQGYDGMMQGRAAAQNNITGTQGYNTQGQAISVRPGVNSNSLVNINSVPPPMSMPNYAVTQYPSQTSFPIGNFYSSSPNVPYQD